MWSGPRNISTAMMRSFENRDDTQVIDEPFYAWYLHTTGIEHPMNREVIASQPTDWRTVANTLSAERKDIAVVYQKHMTHHMLPEIDLDWTSGLRNCFLIRDPVYVVNSYAKKRDTLTQDDIGIRRQFELYNEIADITEQQIPVVDAAQFLRNPERHLRALCTHFGIGYSEKMLHWPKGRRDSDGVWAAHWYEVVELSTGFQPFTAPEVNLSPLQQKIADEPGEYYQLLLSKSLAL